MSSQTARSGSRIERWIRLLASAVPRRTIQDSPTPITTPMSPTSSATHQLANVKPLIRRQSVAVTGIRMPARTNDGTPTSRDFMISTSDCASKRAGRSSFSSAELDAASISRAQ